MVGGGGGGVCAAPVYHVRLRFRAVRCLMGVGCVVCRVGNLSYRFVEWLLLVLLYGRDFAP